MVESCWLVGVWVGFSVGSGDTYMGCIALTGYSGGL